MSIISYYGQGSVQLRYVCYISAKKKDTKDLSGHWTMAGTPIVASYLNISVNIPGNRIGSGTGEEVILFPMGVSSSMQTKQNH